MKDRIKRIRTDAGMTQEEFGREIGATRGMVTTYEKGTIPTQSTRMLICSKFNVSETWLETGEGVPYKEGLIPELANALRSMPSVAAALERLLPRMTPEDFAHIDEMVRKICEDK
jgi:transcriptional regulator with XRE-family HTH domain